MEGKAKDGGQDSSVSQLVDSGLVRARLFKQTQRQVLYKTKANLGINFIADGCGLFFPMPSSLQWSKASPG